MMTFDRILLPTDFSDAAADAEVRARAIARLFGAELHVLHVTQGLELSELPMRLRDNDGPAAERLYEHVSGWLGMSDASGEGAQDGGLPVVRSVRRARTPHRGILEYAADADVDLIVMGTSGRGGGPGSWLGSAAERVLRRARCPVVSVRPDVEPRPPERLHGTGDDRLLVVPVDVNDASHDVVSKAKHWAATFDARLDLVHVLEGPRIPMPYPVDRFRSETPARATRARSRLDRLAEEAPGPRVDVVSRILTGDPADEITRYAEAQEARMILMPASGSAALHAFVLGNTTKQVVQSAPCPVGTMGRRTANTAQEPDAQTREPNSETREPNSETREPSAETREPNSETREPSSDEREPDGEARGAAEHVEAEHAEAPAEDGRAPAEAAGAPHVH
jgi:nucleotide-binding universal stress UspA family protein